MRKKLISFAVYITLIWLFLMLPGYIIGLLFLKQPFADPFLKSAYLRIAFYYFSSSMSLYFCIRIWLSRFNRPAKMLKEYITGMILWIGLILSLALPLLKIVDDSELILGKPVSMTGNLISISEHGPHILPFANELGVIPSAVDKNLDIKKDTYKRGIAFQLSNSDVIFTTPFFYNKQFLKDHQERFNQLINQEITVTYYPISQRIVAVATGNGSDSDRQYLLYDKLYYDKR